MNLDILFKPLRCSRCGKLFDKREIDEASRVLTMSLFLFGSLPEKAFCGKCSRINEVEQEIETSETHLL